MDKQAFKQKEEDLLAEIDNLKQHLEERELERMMETIESATSANENAQHKEQIQELQDAHRRELAEKDGQVEGLRLELKQKMTIQEETTKGLENVKRLVNQIQEVGAQKTEDLMRQLHEADAKVRNLQTQLEEMAKAQKAAECAHLGEISRITWQKDSLEQENKRLRDENAKPVYRKCSPTSSGRRVYVTNVCDTRGCYHFSRGCYGADTSIPIARAREERRSPCNHCTD